MKICALFLGCFFSKLVVGWAGGRVRGQGAGRCARAEGAGRHAGKGQADIACAFNQI